MQSKRCSKFLRKLFISLDIFTSMFFWPCTLCSKNKSGILTKNKFSTLFGNLIYICLLSTTISYVKNSFSRTRNTSTYLVNWRTLKGCRGRGFESIYSTVNIKFCPKPNLRAITQIRSILKEVSRIAAVKFTTNFAIILRQGWSYLSSIYGNCLLW